MVSWLALLARVLPYPMQNATELVVANDGGHRMYESANPPGVSSHALQRMRERGITGAAVQATLAHGRVAHVRGAAIHAIGRKEVSAMRRKGIELADYEGVQVVCAPDGAILTAYRNRNFRGLRPRHRRVAGRRFRPDGDQPWRH